MADDTYGRFAPSIADDDPDLTIIEREKLMTEILRWKADAKAGEHYPDKEWHEDCKNVMNMTDTELLDLYEHQMVSYFLPRNETGERYSENGVMPDVENIIDSELRLLLHPELKPKHGHVRRVVPVRLVTDDAERERAWTVYFDKYDYTPAENEIEDPHYGPGSYITRRTV